MLWRTKVVKPRAESEDDPTALGASLVRLGYATREQVESAAKESGERLGECLLEKKIITEEQLEQALRHQGALRGTVGQKEGVKVLFEQHGRAFDQVIKGTRELSEMNSVLLGRLKT